MKDFVISDIEKAILQGMKTITIEGVEIKLPSPQTAGTLTQRKAYARMESEKLCNTLKL